MGISHKNFAKFQVYKNTSSSYYVEIFLEKFIDTTFVLKSTASSVPKLELWVLLP